MNDITSRLMAVFLAEMEERLNGLESDLLRLEGEAEGGERDEIVRNLLRGAHSLKGAATSVGVSDVESVAHALEELLVAMRDGTVEGGPGPLRLLLENMDRLRETARRLREGRSANAEPAHSGPTALSDNTVRVRADRLDSLLQQSGELLVASHHARSRLGDFESLRENVHRLRHGATAGDLRNLERDVEHILTAFEADHRVLEHAARVVDAGIRRIRMLPFITACAGLDRIVRDAAQASGKEIQLHVQGGEIEFDRSILQGLRDPLIHLVRNAIDHGIELPDRRAEKGKARMGTVTISAALRGEGVEVTVADNGAGIDGAALRARAVERGLTVDALDLTETIFLPGLSTAKQVTGLSGRGVGLDAVQAAVNGMRGTISVASIPDRETKFILNLPLTLTTVRVVLLDVAGHTFALDTTVVARVVRVRADAIVPIEGRPVIVSGDQFIPIVPFAEALDMPAVAPPGETEFVTAVVVNVGEQQVALRVDALHEEREILVRSLGPRLAAVQAVSGATVLMDGSVALIVRTAFVLERALGLTRTVRHHRPERHAVRKKRILLVDDSVTTRTLERSILEAADYDVITSGDGEQALNALGAADVDLIVSDVDMPKMDGFALVEAVRHSERLRGLPVVLVTARESDEDRRRGLDAGADAYVLKSTFDQQALLGIIADLL